MFLKILNPAERDVLLGMPSLTHICNLQVFHIRNKNKIVSKFGSLILAVSIMCNSDHFDNVRDLKGKDNGRYT